MEEIEEEIKFAESMMVEKPCNKLDKITNDTAEAFIGAYKECSKIIRSHIEHLPNVDAEEKSILCTVGEDGVLSEYDDTYDVVIHCTSKEDQEQTVKFIKDSNWIPVSERLPEEDDLRFYMCVLENHEEDLPMFCQYNEMYGFGFWSDIYDPISLGFVDAEFSSMDELGYEKVVAWRPLPEPYCPEVKE